jgi:hypothetical protein
MPNLSDQARKSIIAISVIAVASVVGLLIWTLVVALSGSIDGEHYPGTLLLILVGGSGAIFGRSLAGLLLVVSYGATAVAGSKLKDALYYSVVGLSGAGILITIALMIVMYDARLAAHVARASDTFDTVEAYRAAQNLFLGAILVWLIGTLTTQLGIEAKSKDKGADAKDQGAT